MTLSLESLAKRVAANERRHRSVNRRTRVIAVFTLASFLVLAWRTEVTDDLNAELTREVRLNQDSSCYRGTLILVKFNNLQDQLADIERRNMSVAPEIRFARIHSYEAARILPLPSCPARMNP